MKRLPYIFVVFLFVSALFPACDCGDSSNNVVEIDQGDPDVGLNNSTDMDLEDLCSACREDQRCVDSVGGQKECTCPAGSSEQNGACEPDTTCLETTCNGHGECTDDNGPACSCELGWAGEFCGECDAVNGWVPNGEGGCTDDVCTTIQCIGEQVCEDQNGAPVCMCPAGTHDDGNGGCEDDEVCGPTTCAMNGTCADTATGPVCTCDPGWQPPNCQMCDGANGYHADGMGGCTTDLCIPNPCQDANRSVCSSDGVTVSCECDPGYHLEAAVCVVDEVCQPESCSMHGPCDDSTGRIVCTCDAGYLGDDCSMCDAANGYHDDGTGTGTCTTDLCLPNPCDQVANKTVCTEVNGGTQCSCDAGFHDDGLGGCTTDVCLPDLCAINNQSCRVTNGLPECYTPVCDDQNPCTVGVVVNGVCQYSNEPDNTSCDPDACTVNSICTAGVCGGGSARICNDANSCTDDSCDLVTGCVFTNDDTNTPSDGIACTDDVCANGFESHPPVDANCDNAMFCDGQEVCIPSDPNSDANGCLVTNVPTAPPNPGPCATYGACDELTDSFPLNQLGAGASCNDGVWCTTGDVCDANGICLGTPNNCGDPNQTTCTTTTPYNGIDLYTTALTTNITVDGVPLSMVATDSTTTNVYAVDTTTGTRHNIAYWYGNTVRLSERILPGTYDIMYRRGISSDTDKYAYSTDSSDAMPNAMVYLQRGIVVPAGSHTFNVDIPVTSLTTNVTIDGVPLAMTTTDSTTTNVYAVDSETGTRHNIAYWYGSTVRLSERILPGTYDIMYRRGISSDSDQYAYSTDSSDAVPNAMTYLQRGVVVPAGSHTFNIDVPVTSLTTNITIDGVPLSMTTTDSTTTNVYAVDTETGTRHNIAYWYGNTERFSERIIPGTYHIMYRRGISSSTDKYAYSTDSSDAVPNGMTFLERDVVVSGASHTFNIDIPVTTLTSNVTIDGVPLSMTTTDSTTTNIYAVDTQTGTRHNIAYWYGSTVRLSERILPGTYDILYRRGISSDTDQYAYSTDSSDAVPNAMTYLQYGVVVSGATHTFNLDVPVTTLTTNITIDGVPLSMSPTDSTTTNVYAVDIETGTRHNIAYWYGNTVRLSERIIPGTYDIMYRRGISSSTDKYAYSTDSSDAMPNAMVYLQRGVVVSANSHVFNINVPVIPLTTTVTVDGVPLGNVPTDSTTTNVYLVNRATRTRHNVAYWYGNTERYSEALLPGTYDIMYRRGISSDTDKYAYSTDSSDAMPNGMTYVGQCISLP